MTSVAHAQPHAHGGGEAHHAPMSFWRTYSFSTDHKIIGIQFLFVSLFFLLVGGILAMQIRWQLGFPAKPMPGGGLLPETMVSDGHILPEYYVQLVSMHGTFMVFFAIMPLLVGVYANFLIPLKIGAHDMAFPRINMWSFWAALLAGLIMTASFFVPNGPIRSGWTNYVPLAARPDLSGVTVGQMLWCISIVVLGLSSVMGSLNYITTIINHRAPGMTWFRMPLSVWGLFITAILGVLALPVLQGAAIMLLFDNVLGTHFFDPAAGGQALLWQHLFWFFGHPEVYILILPAMGMVSDIIANGSRKPIFGYHSMVFAIIGIAFLGWIVWGHHMFMSGMNPTLGSTFMVSTLLIAVPSAVKVFNWMGTMWRGNLRFHVPMMNAIGFVSMFTIGGLSGIYMAATPVDIPLHDTQFIVAHIHYVLFGGSLFALFAAMTYWYPKMFGKMMSERLGKVHFWLTFVFYNMTFFPMHIIGMGGQMRRIYDPTIYNFLKPQQPLNEFISYSAFALFAVQFLFAFNFLWSLKFGKKAPQNPWDDNGLEWSLPNPAPHGNWEKVPNVYRGPYEFSAPEAGDKDYLPQYTKLPTDRDPVPAPVPAGH
jgi:cytochrome c oxidase subunit 1